MPKKNQYIIPPQGKRKYPIVMEFIYAAQEAGDQESIDRHIVDIILQKK